MRSAILASPRLDEDELRLRASMIAAGVWLTYAACAAVLGYLALSWDDPHRGLMTSLSSVALVSGAGIARLPRERILRARWREAFFIIWSALDIALIGVLTALDGATSPLALLFFLTVIFASLSYPLPSVILVAVLNVGTFVAIQVVADERGAHVELAYVWALATSLSLTSAMCVWQARLHDNQRRELARRSRTDPLTGCLNRRGIENVLDETIELPVPFAWLVLDLDRFKDVNDSLGHAAGDELLRWVVTSTTGVLRSEDRLGRLGGDEFAVVLPGANEDDARRIAQRIEHTLAERIKVAIGLACYPQDADTRIQLQRCADADLYAEKRGRALSALVESTPDLDSSDSTSAMASLIGTLELRDEYTAFHSQKVVELSTQVAAELGLDERQLDIVAQVARLHDIGKLSVPDSILNKTCALDASEWELMRRHPTVGAQVIAAIPSLAHLAPLIRAEHERWDGKGYPRGLKGTEIPIVSRIVFACDAYHAMTSDRPYRRAIGAEAARRELRVSAGSQFDPDVVAALLRVLDGRERIVELTQTVANRSAGSIAGMTRAD